MFLIKYITIYVYVVVSKEEYDSLINMFQLLTKDNMHARAHKLDRTQFREVLHSTFHMTDDIIMDRGKLSTFLFVIHDSKLLGVFKIIKSVKDSTTLIFKALKTHCRIS